MMLLLKTPSGHQALSNAMEAETKKNSATAKSFLRLFVTTMARWYKISAFSVSENYALHDDDEIDNISSEIKQFLQS